MPKNKVIYHVASDECFYQKRNKLCSHLIDIFVITYIYCNKTHIIFSLNRYNLSLVIHCTDFLKQSRRIGCTGYQDLSQVEYFGKMNAMQKIVYNSKPLNM